MNDNALYYPYIGFRDPTFVKAMALFYDKVYRIVPNGVVPEDTDGLEALLEDGSIGRMIDPVKYSVAASKSFLKKAARWKAKALSFTTDEAEEIIEITRLHKDKVDDKIRTLFRQVGYQEDDWINIPVELASNYMLYLAREIASNNQLTLITDEWAPWTAISYFNINGQIQPSSQLLEKRKNQNESGFALFSLIVGEIVPVNIREIPAEKVRTFREKRKSEISLFRNSIYELLDQLQQIDDPQIRIDILEDKISDFKNAIDEYRRSADIINVKGWFGSLFNGFPAPAALGNVFHLSQLSVAALASIGLAIGGIVNLATSKLELKRLRKETPVSFLAEFKRRFGRYAVDDSDHINDTAFRSLFEYVND